MKTRVTVTVTPGQPAPHHVAVVGHGTALVNWAEGRPYITRRVASWMPACARSSAWTLSRCKLATMASLPLTASIAEMRMKISTTNSRTVTSAAPRSLVMCLSILLTGLCTPRSSPPARSVAHHRLGGQRDLLGRKCCALHDRVAQALNAHRHNATGDRDASKTLNARCDHVAASRAEQRGGQRLIRQRRELTGYPVQRVRSPCRALGRVPNILLPEGRVGGTQDICRIARGRRGARVPAGGRLGGGKRASERSPAPRVEAESGPHLCIQTEHRVVCHQASRLKHNLALAVRISARHDLGGVGLPNLAGDPIHGTAHVLLHVCGNLYLLGIRARATEHRVDDEDKQGKHGKRHEQFNDCDAVFAAVESDRQRPHGRNRSISRVRATHAVGRGQYCHASFASMRTKDSLVVSVLQLESDALLYFTKQGAVAVHGSGVPLVLKHAYQGGSMTTVNVCQFSW